MAEVLFLDQVNQLSDQAMQLCYHCHKCTAGCPAAFEMEYGPDRILRLIQLGQWERVLASRDIWLCLGCEMCGAHCPNDIDMGAVMVGLRQAAEQRGYRREDCEQLRELVAASLGEETRSLPLCLQKNPVSAPVSVDDRLCEGVQRLNRLSETITTAHNVSGDDNDTRLIWSQNLERVPEGLDGQAGAEIVYFVGCVGAFFPRSYRVPQAMTRILEMAQGAGGATFTTLGGEEWCCGYPLLAMGEIEQVVDLARHNVAQVKALGAARFVSSCPSCYYTWKHVYPGIVGEELAASGIEVLHATELLVELIGQQRIELGELDVRVTYHDPCDLGRKSHVYEPPRQVLQSIPGLTFVEMSSFGQISECCGGGGNLESFDPSVVSEVAHRRVDQACDAGAQVLVSACQQCERTLMAASRRHKDARRARMRVMNLAELVCESVERATGS